MTLINVLLNIGGAFVAAACFWLGRRWERLVTKAKS